MARYLTLKFRWNSLQSQSRYLGNKVDVVPVANRLATPSSEENVDDVSEDHNNNVIRYNVCRNRSTSAQKFVFDRRNVQKKLAGLQDEYDILEPQAESTQQSPPSSKSKSTGGYRAFPASTTYKNVTLPLKSSKLANPFPEPVKLMPSHTVSDQEKADQMQAEFRVPKLSTRKQ